MLRRFCSTAYIIVIESDFGVALGVYSTKGKNILKKYERNYEKPEQAQRFLEQIINNHYFCYVASYFKSIGQGVLPSKNRRDLVKFGIEPSSIGLVLVNDFYLYTSKSEIAAASSCCGNLLQNDLLYSPFSVLHNLQSKLNKSTCNMFLLKYKNLVAVMIYKKGVAKFGNYFELKVNSAEGDIPELDIEGIDYDSAEKFEDLTFDDFENIDNVDNIQASDSFVDHAEDFENSLANFDTEMAIFDYLKTAMREFYENNIYESDFIDELYIFEHEASSEAFLSMIKTELYFNPIVNKIDLFYEILALACKDLGVSLDS